MLREKCEQRSKMMKNGGGDDEKVAVPGVEQPPEQRPAGVRGVAILNPANRS